MKSLAWWSAESFAELRRDEPHVKSRRGTATHKTARLAWTATVAAGLVLWTSIALAAPTCTDLGYNNVPHAKPNKLYLYFPPADDATYPEFGVDGLVTSPAHRFDVSELTSYTGTAAGLRNAIFDVVTDDYCEFDVEVLQTTTAPSGPATRRNTLAIGTDSAISNLNSNTWGLAQNVDTGDGTAIDFARVWGGTYQVTAGGAGGALNGANSTLERWARSIGGTCAHEGGHNYGLSHGDGLVVGPGEDALTRHLMAKGSHYTDEQRAGYRRHFSDHEYSILAANVGLSVQTMFNWDFINPNMQTATKLRIDFLSLQSPLTLASVYTGSLSPWVSPSVSGPLGDQNFKGVSYHRYQITWSTGQAWSGGAAGQVAGGAGFHVGASFVSVDYNTPDPIIITNVDLLDAGNATLALHPRLAGFDAGTLDAADGSFSVDVINFQGSPLLIQDVSVQFLPRLVSIDAMVPGAKELVDPFGESFPAWKAKRLDVKAELRQGSDIRIPLAWLKDGRNIVERIDERNCNGGADIRGPESDTRGCKPGINVDMFPATSMLITATVVDPAAKHWDPNQNSYVTGPVATKVFYQLAGRHPDLNQNGVDDFVDIATGRSQDVNLDGVVDEVQGGNVPSTSSPDLSGHQVALLAGGLLADDALPLRSGFDTSFLYRRHRFAPLWSWEFETGIAFTATAASSGLLADAQLHLVRHLNAPPAKVQPFLLAGAGAAHFSALGFSDTAPLLTLGIGTDFVWTPKVGFRLDLRALWLHDLIGSGWTKNVQVLWGPTFSF
jgi:hypothetical protein